MSKAAVIGIDAGTTNLKLAALDHAGWTVAESSFRYSVDSAANGIVTQDVQAWWRGLDFCMREAGQQCELAEVQAMALSCQGETLVCCDGGGTALEPAISWMDTRAQAEMEELAASRTDWYERTGKPIGAYSTLAKIVWLRKRRPESCAKVSRFCQVADYLTARMTGQWILDTSNASFTSLFDVRRRCWDDELCTQFELEGRLPRVAESGTAAGLLDSELARRWGLGEKVSVVLGGHDQGCAALGAAAPEEPAVVLSTGTAWVLYCATPQPRFDPGRRMIAYCHARPNWWAALGAYCGGGVLDTFLNRFCQDPLSAKASDQAPDYDRFLRKENLCEDLLVLPFLFGANTPDNDPTARAAILNLGPNHGPGHVAVGIMDAIGFETRRNLELLAQIGIAPRRVKMVGGACRSDLWPQLIADTCRMPVDALEQSQVAPLGAAWLAGQAIGLWGSTGLPHYPAARTYEPSAEGTMRAERKFQRYLDALRLDCQRRRLHTEALP